MDWMSWKTWTAVGGLIIAVFAIYLFAGPPVTLQLQPVPKDASIEAEARSLSSRTGSRPITASWAQVRSKDAASGESSSEPSLTSRRRTNVWKLEPNFTP